jgi:hypothetical protein
MLCFAVTLSCSSTSSSPRPTQLAQQYDTAVRNTTEVCIHSISKAGIHCNSSSLIAFIQLELSDSTTG